MTPNYNAELEMHYGVFDPRNIDFFYETIIECGDPLLDEDEEYPEDEGPPGTCDGEVAVAYSEDDVDYLLEWLGGAPIVFVLNSPWYTRCQPCSPCCPNAGDLDARYDLGSPYLCPPQEILQQIDPKYRAWPLDAYTHEVQAAIDELAREVQGRAPSDES